LRRIGTLAPWFERDAQVVAIPGGELRRVRRFEKDAADPGDALRRVVGVRSSSRLDRHSQQEAQRQRTGNPYFRFHRASRGTPPAPGLQYIAALSESSIAKLDARVQNGLMSVEIAKKILDGQSVEKQVLADTVPVTSGDTAKADRYEYKSDCSLSY